MSAADDRELVLRAQRGDLEAFGELVRTHQSAVFNVAYTGQNDQRRDRHPLSRPGTGHDGQLRTIEAPAGTDSHQQGNGRTDQGCHPSTTTPISGGN